MSPWGPELIFWGGSQVGAREAIAVCARRAMMAAWTEMVWLGGPQGSGWVTEAQVGKVTCPRSPS